MADRGYSDEQWAAACEQSGELLREQCVGQFRLKGPFTFPCQHKHKAPHVIEHLPEVGDPATVLAMLGWLARQCALPDLRWSVSLGHTASDGHRLTTDGVIAAIVLACAALPKEDKHG